MALKKPYGTDDSFRYLATNQLVGHVFKVSLHLKIRRYYEASPETPCCEHTVGSYGCLHYSMNKGVYRTHVDICHTKNDKYTNINYIGGSS